MTPLVFYHAFPLFTKMKLHYQYANMRHASVFLHAPVHTGPLPFAPQAMPAYPKLETKA